MIGPPSRPRNCAKRYFIPPAPPIGAGARGKKEICVIFDDMSRPTRVAPFTPHVLDELRYCRRLIEVAAPGGGFLLDTGAVLYEGREENVKAMLQAAYDHGKYR